MRKVNIVCVGKIKEKYLTQGIEEYAKRLSRFCSFTVTELPDECGDCAVKKESEAIVKKLKGFVIICDLGGKQVTSPELAQIMEKAYLTAPEVTFVIGGSEGFDDSVRAKASERIAFGKVTYPHQLMRLILSEQIYRAFNILENTPYHK